MLELGLNKRLIRRAIDERFDGSISALMERMSATGAIHRTTLWRWLTSPDVLLPRYSETTLSLAAAMDVDPIAIWRFDRRTFPLFCREMEKAVRTGEWGKLPSSMSYLEHLFHPLAEWPPEYIARDYFQRLWVTRAFKHDPQQRRNYFARLLLDPCLNTTAHLTRVWHFAYRDVGVSGSGPWRPYGFVQLDEETLRLYSINGTTGVTSGGTRAFVVETWLGEGAAEFRIASLHPFILALRNLVRAPHVRFGFVT